MNKKFHEANRLSWNAATVVHNSHKHEQAAFLRQGGNTLYPEELSLLGDIKGLNILHLQCNSGQDTLSLAQHGANVTGVDISDEAINFARQLSIDSGIPAQFHLADIFDWMEQAITKNLQFDRVFCSYGALIWLSDLNNWAKLISQLLTPKGKFIAVEFHPLAFCLDAQWQPYRDYFREGLAFEAAGVEDYVADYPETLCPSKVLEGITNFQNPHPSFEFHWGTHEVVNALIQAGLRIEQFNEYPYSNGWSGLAGMRHIGDNRLAQPEGMPRIPLMYSVLAGK
ncbi:class I SAM-dependent methyltransferase [Photorhabdus luminescens]|uniref:class I SAM-dependent methyltransferase n=1 Tax=Photorhabdus luminescens TaxID=29488 RepID=UPI00224054C2|nr:class I SAM-dependent methyltransferase [Photorhabdus luminescens]MCW7761607.1 class I SAM-dependent methyltransferase [Photorhabdus luminescens subsp. venezuelensis]